jgi:prepilin-type N-terminal cleavage/methylation domain-containing protein
MNMYKKPIKGFTLIELLIVVAIIGMLSAVVLSSLGGARKKAQDAKTRAELSQLRTQAEMYTDTYGNYGTGSGLAGSCNTTGNMFADTKMIQLLTSINGAVLSTTTSSSPVCGISTGAWVVWAPLRAGSGSNPYGWCVDSTGVSKAMDTPPPNGSAFTSCV